MWGKLTKRSKRYWAAGAVLVVLYAVLTYFVVDHIAIEGSDFYPHTDAITTTLFQRGPISFFARSPYFGFHAVELPFILLGLSVSQASAFACAIFNALTAVVVLLFVSKLTDPDAPIALPLGLSAVLLFVSAIWVPSFNPEVYIGQGSPTIWHNPTYYAIKPFALLTIGLFIKLTNESFESKRDCIWLSVLIFVGIIMKPVFFQCFFPAVLVVYVIRRLTGIGMSARSLWVFLPSILLGCIVVFLMFFRHSPTSGEDEGGIALSFFGGWSKATPNPWVSMLLLYAFPLYAVAVNWRDFLSIRSSKFIVLLTTAFGWLEYMLIVETGPRAAHGNFGWGTCISLFLLWVYALPAFANNTLKRDRPWPVLAIGWGLVGWHLVSGLYYVYHLLTSNVLW